MEGNLICIICVTSVSTRQALSRFRIGVSVVRVETGTYESNGTNGRRGIPIQIRVCKCSDLCKKFMLYMSAPKGCAQCVL